MKEKFVSVLKKAVVIIIASVMVLGIVPVGLLTLKPRTASAEGEFLRFSPSAEVSVMSRTEAQKLAGRSLPEGLYPISGDSDTYLQFDLRSLTENEDLGAVQKATLRLVAVNCGIESSQPVRLWLMPHADWDEDMDYQERPSALGEVKIQDLQVDTSQRETQVIEVDLTAYLQKWLEDNTQKVSLHLDAGGSGMAGVFAGTAYEDAVCRPCLKVVTGEAEDPDSLDLTKTWLEKTAVTGTGGGNQELRVGNGADTYLKFGFHAGNIQGAMHMVNLKLRMLRADEAAEIFIYKISNGQWNEGEALPKGEESLVYSARATDGNAVENIDLSHVVNDAYARGEVSLTLRIGGGEQGEVVFSNQGSDAPRLRLRVSDQPSVMAAVEASIYALEGNPSPDAITGHLSENYTTEAGARAEVRWTAVDAVTGEDAREVLAANGRITRPQWFENSRKILATASITSGDYSRERGYQLTVLPEDMPDYSQRSFGNYVRLGSPGHESEYGFGEVGAPAHSRWIDGKNFSYRTPEPEGSMAMSLAVDPERQNYLTVKIWKAEKPTSSLVVENLQDRAAAPLVIQVPAELSAEDGFLYLTYPLPLEQTQGKQHISLRLRPDAETAETAEGVVPWNIYSVYSGVTSYFDPLTYAEQGEVFAGKTPDGDLTFTKLLRRMYMGALEPWEDFTERWRAEDAEEPPAEEVPQASAEPEEALQQEERIIRMEAEPPILAFDDGGDRIAISVWESSRHAEVHRNSGYYDTYAEADLKHYGDGLTAIDYDHYRIFRNISDREQAVPWREEALAGIYQDLVSGGYYAFLRDGEMADDSVMPSGTALELGSNLKIPAQSTLVLEKLAEPLYGAAWRVSEINGRTVAQVKLNRELSISQLTVKNAGKDPEQGEDLQVICCAYENGRLCGISRQTFTVIPGFGEYTLAMPSMTVMPGQTLKIFVEPVNQQPHAISSKLELP